MLISDAPDHGYAMPGMQDDHPYGLDRTLDETLLEMKKKQIDLLYCPILPKLSANFDSELAKCYEDVMKRETFSEQSNHIIPLFKGHTLPGPFYFVFCFDSSGSMQDDW